MPTSVALSGPYLLDRVDDVVRANSMGAYVLSRDGKTAAYVGRSDSDLAGRIKSSAAEGSGYRYFWFTYATSRLQAFETECVLYHDLQPPDNSVHPAAPTGTSYRCPVFGCPWSRA